MRYQLRVPTTFWNDHLDRQPSDDGAAGICRTVKAGPRLTLIEGTKEQIETLKKDAAYYGDLSNWDVEFKSDYRWLVRSAQSTIASLARAGY